jgi:uncharacterized protein (TIGR02001 family)
MKLRLLTGVLLCALTLSAILSGMSENAFAGKNIDTGDNTFVGPVQPDEDEGNDSQDEGKDLSANVSLSSDYILRGLSQSEHQPVVQGGLDWYLPMGIYLGVWASSVEFQGLNTSLELDPYGGYYYEFANGIKASAGFLYYSYWSDINRNGFLFPLRGEWKNYSLEMDFAPSWQGGDAASWYFVGGWQHKLFYDAKLGILAGYSFFSNTTNEQEYADFRINLSHDFLGVEWMLSGVFTTSDQVINDAAGGSRAVVSVTKTF